MPTQWSIALNHYANRSYVPTRRHQGPVEAPQFESLENRLLLDAVPVFGTELSDFYVLDSNGGLTLGIDGFDADADDVLTLGVDFGAGAGEVSATVYDWTSNNRYAVLHFDDDNGDPIGDLVVQLFEGRSPLATERFITLATQYIAADGTMSDPTVDDPAYYTDVKVHRVIDDFMLQTGDAEHGNGTGGSPLGDFADQFDPDLSFAGLGALALANSGDDTNDSQFFITDGTPRHLDGDHTIFGQLISGWDIYEQLISVEVDSNDRPVDPPILTSVDIIDNSDFDGSITLTATEDFNAPVEATITLTDSTGKVAHKTITLVPPAEVDDITFTDIGDVAFAFGAPTEFEIPITYDGVSAVTMTVETDYDGLGDVIVTVDDPAAGGDPHIVHVTLPAQYNGATFSVTVKSTLDDWGNLTPRSHEYDISLGDRPTIDDPGRVDISPDAPFGLPLTITDDDADVFEIAVTADHDDATVEIDEDTYELTITPPADFLGAFDVTVTVTETAWLAQFPSLTANELTFTVTTLGERPTIADPTPIFEMTGGTLESFKAGIVDDSDVELLVTISSAMNTDNSTFAWIEIIDNEESGEPEYWVNIDLRSLPSTFAAAFKVTIEAVEKDYKDIVDAGAREFRVVSASEFDPPIVSFVDVVGAEEVMITRIVGDRLYVGTMKSLSVYDAGDPTDLQLLGAYETNKEVRDIEVVGDVVYVATHGQAWGQYIFSKGAVLALDVSDPAAEITLLDTVETDSLVYGIDIDGDRLFVANWAEGMLVLDITDPADLTQLAAFAPAAGTLTLAKVTDVVVSGDRAFVLDHGAGVVALDIRDLDAIEKLVAKKTNVYSYAGEPSAVAVQDGKLYVADAVTGMFVYDLSNPAKLKELGWLGWPASHMTISGNLAIVSQGGYHRFADISNPAKMVVSHFFFAPGWVGGSSINEANFMAVPNGEEGVAIFDGTDLLDSVTVYDKRTVTDANGAAVTLKIQGGGVLRVHQDDNGAITHLEVIEAGPRTKVTVTTAGGVATTIGDITAYDSIKSITATTTTLLGDITVAGTIKAISLGGVGDDASGEQLITIEGEDVFDPAVAVALSLGAVQDLTIVSATPIKSLKAHEWLDDETDAADSITAPSMGTLRIAPPRNNPATGDFEADLTLNENGDAPTAVTLGSANIAGEVTDADWMIYGAAGTIEHTGGGWTPTLDESLRPTTVYDKRTFDLGDGVALSFRITGGGTLRVTPGGAGEADFEEVQILDPTAKTQVTVKVTGGAATLGDITAAGTLASIHLGDTILLGDVIIEGALASLTTGAVAGGEQLIRIDGDDAISFKAAVTLKLGTVEDLRIESAMPIKSLTAADWIDDETETTDSIVAPSLGKLTIKPPRGVAGGGDFQANLTLNEDGDAPAEPILGRADIAGTVTESVWTVYGAAGPINATGDGTWTRDIDDGFRATTIYDKRTLTLANGSVVTLKITGGGEILVTPDADAVADIGGIEILNPTAKTQVFITSADAITVMSITADDTLKSIKAPAVHLVGDLSVDGNLRSLVLGDVSGIGRREQLIRIIGSFTRDPKAVVAITLGAVSDLRIITAVPIKSLTAAEWLDDETDGADGGDWLDDLYDHVDTIMAPSLGTLTIKPTAAGGSGRFQADLQINPDDNATMAKVLGTVSIAGQVSDADWDIDGDAGVIRAAATAGDWSLDVEGTVHVVQTTSGLMDGSVAAKKINQLKAKTLLTVGVLTTGIASDKVSIGLLTAQSVSGATFVLDGGVQTIKVNRWTGSQLIGDWIGSVKVAKIRGLVGAGNFDGSLSVTGEIKTVTVAGDLTGDGAWRANSVGAITVKGDVTDLDLTLLQSAGANLKHKGLGTFNVGGRLSNSSIMATGHIGAITVGAMENTDIYAGYIGGAGVVTGLPDGSPELISPALFDALAQIKKIVVKGQRVGGTPLLSFIDSNIASGGAIGSVKLTYADTDPDAAEFGVIARDLNSYTYKDADPAKNVSWTSRSTASSPDNVDNLVVRLV